MSKAIGIVFCALTLSACVSTPPDPFVWVRTDGQKMTGNPALEQQAKIDLAICNGETQRSAVGMAPVYYNDMGGAIAAGMINGQRSQALNQVAEGCMAQKGYVRVPMSQAAATAASLAATTKERASLAPKS